MTDLSRRAFLESAATGAVGATLLPWEGDRERTDDPRVADLPADRTRPWLGPPFWANRLQDWRLHEGRIECLRGEAGFEVRTVGLLTRELVEGQTTARLRVTTGLLEGEGMGGFCGLLVGVGNGALDHRAAALAQRGSGIGGGIMATFNTDGRVSIREHYDQDRPLGFAELSAEKTYPTGDPVRPVQGASYELLLEIEPQRNEHFTLRITVLDEKEDAIAVAQRRDVREEDVLGGISLVSSPPVGESGARWWFRDLQTTGEKVAERPERSVGPVLGTLFSLDRDVLKLSAQLMPIDREQAQPVRLEYRPEAGDGDWSTAEASIEPGYVATFRIEGWDPSRAWDYRVVYPRATGERTEYRGRIPQDPAEKASEPETTIGLFSCVAATSYRLETSTGRSPLPMGRRLGLYTPEGMYFPHAELVKNALTHDPDVLVVCGDQFYEGNPTRLPRRENPPELDYLYKWYLWLWSFREATRSTPAILLVDDHDVYHPNIWGEGGERAPLRSADGQTRDWREGGYLSGPEFVNMVQRTQCGHNPDPYDPTPVEQGISVYYTSFEYGGIDFAVVEDRKFKSAPDAELGPRGGELLGKRQEQFLEAWGQKPGSPKICLSQTCYGSVHTDPAGHPAQDPDTNGYPPKGRERAIRLLRQAGALLLSGDQHLSTIVRHGLEGHTDGPLQFSGPAGGTFWQRWFDPAEPLSNPRGTLDNTGNFEDAFGNTMRVLAATNPKLSFSTYRDHVDQGARIHDRLLKREGYGIVRVNHEDESAQLECWPWDEDPRLSEAEQFEGWPYRVSFDQFGAVSKEDDK